VPRFAPLQTAARGAACAAFFAALDSGGGRGLCRVLRRNKLRIVDESVPVPVVRLHDGVDHVAQLIVLEAGLELVSFLKILIKKFVSKCWEFCIYILLLKL
jgi:hypothetical protein